MIRFLLSLSKENSEFDCLIHNNLDSIKIPWIGDEWIIAGRALKKVMWLKLNQELRKDVDISFCLGK